VAWIFQSIFRTLVALKAQPLPLSPLPILGQTVHFENAVNSGSSSSIGKMVGTLLASLTTVNCPLKRQGYSILPYSNVRCAGIFLSSDNSQTFQTQYKVGTQYIDVLLDPAHPP
jgi:hypothetical protein